MKDVKRTISLVLSFIIVITTAITPSADYYEDYEYAILSDNTIEITKYIGSDEKIEIPSQINGFAVTKIGSEAFMHNSSIKNVVIPDNILRIEKLAFDNCSELVSVFIGSGVYFIGERAFDDCKKLENITVDENNEKYANDEYGVLFDIDANFSGLSYDRDDMGNEIYVRRVRLIQYPTGNKRTNYTVPDGVLGIGAAAFYGATNLNEVVIPDDVGYIDEWAFQFCTGLKSLIIHSGKLALKCFADCINLTNLTLGVYDDDSADVSSEGKVNINDLAFENCYNVANLTIGENMLDVDKGSRVADLSLENGLKKITVDKDNEYYSSDEYGVLYNKDKTELIQYPIGSEMKEFTVPETVKFIRADAFSECSNLEKIIVADDNENYSNDEYGALYNKDKTELIQYPVGNKNTEYTILETVDILDSSSFRKCVNLENINVNKNNKNYSSDKYGVLYNKNKTCLMQYPAGSKRSEYLIPESVENIVSYAFNYCANLSKIMVDENNKSYSSDKNGVLFDKNKYSLYKYPDGNKSEKYTLPYSVVGVDYYAFFNNKYISEITMSNKSYGIFSYAISRCDSLKTINYGGDIRQFLNSNIVSPNENLFTANIVFDYNPPHNHEYDEMIIRKSACTEDGVKVYTCLICGDGYSETIPAAGHTEGEWEIIFPADIGKEGLEQKKCAVCGEIIEERTIPALPENSADVVPESSSTVPPVDNTALPEENSTSSTVDDTPTTSEPAAEETTTKASEPESFTQSAPQEHTSENPHVHDYVATITESTCTKNGFAVYTCSVCGDSYTEIIPAKGHIAGEWRTVYPADIGREGLERQECRVCGEILNEKTIPALEESESSREEKTTESDNNKPTHEHNYIKTVVQPTCTENGYVDYACSECGANYKEIIPAKGHEASEWEIVIPAKKGKTGLKQIKCVVCGEVLEEETIPALEEPASEQVNYALGDINNDNKITASDARLVLRFSAKIVSPTESEKDASDVNRDGKITASDARHILRVSAKLESSL